jgi:RNA polymerase sigma factor (sigma-70 family)
MAKTTVNPILHMIRRLAEDQHVKTLPDQDLLQRFTSSQDAAAFAGLVRRHGAMVLDVCRKVAGNDADAEDAFQATFLILARKARSIRNLLSVGSWLHGVAYRTALSGRKEIARRRKFESRTPRPAATESADDLPWREVQSVIHAELAALSDHYRAPLVLCFLEGKTQDEAAKQLGVSKTTLKKRLERGRSLLRGRLVRRGLGWAAVLAASAWPAATPAACLPPLLVSATVKAGIALAGGQVTVGLVSGSVACLVENTLKFSLSMKLKVATAIVLVVALMPTIGGWALRQLPKNSAATGAAAQTTRQPAASKSQTAPKPSETPKQQPLEGRVFDSAGRPAGGAKLLLLGANEHPMVIGKSAADGSFKVTITAQTKGKSRYLVAQVEGAGLDFVPVPDKVPSAPIELRTVKDNVIRGRIINTEGRPISGARVAVTELGIYADNLLDSFFTAWKNRRVTDDLPRGVKHFRGNTDSLISVTTDSAGRFTLPGVGIERAAELRIRAPGIADTTAWVVNREGFDPSKYNQIEAENFANSNKGMDLAPYWLRLLHGPDVTVIAEAERPLRGVVKDADSGKPLAGVVVSLSRDGKRTLLPLVLIATSDAAGRYEIRGAHKAKAYMVEVPSDPAAGYLACQVHIADTAGYEPIVADIAVKKGVVVTGRVIDAATRKPVPGWAQVEILSINPFVKDYPDLGSSAFAGSGTQYTVEDGTFRVVAIPGPLLLMGGPDRTRFPNGEIGTYKYKPSVPDPKFPQYFVNGYGSIGFHHPGGGFSQLYGNFCKVLHLKLGVDVVTQDVIIAQAAALPVTIQDGDGRPLPGTWVTGINWAEWHRPLQVEKAACAVYLEPGKPRLMVFYEPNKRLIGTLALQGDEMEPTAATLGRSAAVTGRLVSEDSKPLAGIAVNLHFPERTAAEIHDHIHSVKLVETDAEGRFQVSEVIPALKFSIWFGRGSQIFEPMMNLEERSVQAGRTLDLGDVKVKLKTEQEN